MPLDTILHVATTKRNAGADYKTVRTWLLKHTTYQERNRILDALFAPVAQVA